MLELGHLKRQLLQLDIIKVKVKVLSTPIVKPCSYTPDPIELNSTDLRPVLVCRQILNIFRILATELS